MKSTIIAFAATIGAAAASALHARHEEFHKRAPWQQSSSSSSSSSAMSHQTSYPSYFQHECCQNVVTVTVYGSMSSAPVSAQSHSSTPAAPTPLVTTCPTPGVYTFPAQTVTVTESITVVAYTTTTLTPGHNQYGGHTTTVTAPTTVTCPYVAPSSSGAVVTSVISTTTYVCPSAGTYTIVAPSQTTCSTSTVMVYPVPSQVSPGTYTRPAATVTALVEDYVYWCPYEGVWSTTLVTETPTAHPTQTSKSSQPQQTQSPGKVNHNGNLWGMTYTQYTAGGQCKTADQVSADIQLIASYGFTTVRIYATDCQALQNVGAACRTHSLKLVLGVFIEESGIQGAQSQVTDIVNWGKGGNWDLVELIVIGNEAIFNNYCSPEALAGFISSCKSTFGSAGYSGPVTTTEPLATLQQSGGSLCEVIDVVAANLQPFFNADTCAESAGSFVASELELVAAVCPGKTPYNLESGWPSGGSNNGQAVPGPDHQRAAIEDIIAHVGQSTIVFSFENDLWKQPGPFGVEQHFGAGGLFGDISSS